MKKTHLHTNRFGVSRRVCNTGSATLGWRWQLVDRDVYLRYCNPHQWDTELARRPRRWGRRPCVRRGRPDVHEDFLGSEFARSYHRFAFGRAPASPASHWLRARGYEEIPF